MPSVVLRLRETRLGHYCMASDKASIPLGEISLLDTSKCTKDLAIFKHFENSIIPLSLKKFFPISILAILKTLVYTILPKYFAKLKLSAISSSTIFRFTQFLATYYLNFSNYGFIALKLCPQSRHLCLYIFSTVISSRVYS